LSNILLQHFFQLPFWFDKGNMPSKVAKNDLIRHEKLMSKLLSRIATELGRLRITVTSEIVDCARESLLSKWQEHGGSLSDADIRQVVKLLKMQSGRSQSALDAPRQPLPELPAVHRAVTPSVNQAAMEGAREPLLLHTTKKQRLMMADKEWIDAASRDRTDGVEGKKREKMHHLEVMQNQKGILDRQMEERRRQQEEEQQAKARRQQEMSDIIARTKELEHQEHLAALRKAQKEREFREKQQREIDAERERQRIEEHNEQIRLVAKNQDELRRQKETDQARKIREQEEWKKTVADNQLKLAEKERERERTREIDRDYQRQYVEAQEKQERERAEAKQRKETRAAYFQKLAGGVAQLFMAKEQDLSSKIESEYQAQLQRSLEDERERSRKGKMRLQQCLETQQRQIAEKKRREAEEKEEFRRYARSLQAQAREANEAEEARKRAQKVEAVRTKEFLSTQLQMAHFKETKPLETSIARPPSAAATMYSPSRYTASVTPSL
jgi:hypothetical protein